MSLFHLLCPIEFGAKIGSMNTEEWNMIWMVLRMLIVTMFIKPEPTILKMSKTDSLGVGSYKL